MGAKVDAATLATVRQDFMAGMSLRDLADKYGISLRTLATHSKKDEWAVQRDLQRFATTVPMLAEAADRRVEAVKGDWANVIERLTQNMMNAINKAGELLGEQSLEKTDFKDQASLIRVLIDGLAKLKELAPEQTPAEKEPIKLENDDDRADRITELLERARARRTGSAVDGQGGG
jgi:hypothetical protein